MPPAARKAWSPATSRCEATNQKLPRIEIARVRDSLRRGKEGIGHASTTKCLFHWNMHAFSQWNARWMRGQRSCKMHAKLTSRQTGASQPRVILNQFFVTTTPPSPSSPLSLYSLSLFCKFYKMRCKREIKKKKKKKQTTFGIPRHIIIIATTVRHYRRTKKERNK